MRKGLKSRATFEFVNAPYEVSSAAAEQAVGVGGQREGGRSWWKLSAAEKQAAPEVADAGAVSGDGAGAAAAVDEGDGFESAYLAIKTAVEEHKPDVLLGFSQGASSIALFLARSHVRDPDLLKGLQCAVFIGGFLPQDPVWANEIAVGPGPPAIRSLHIYGAADERVTPARAKALVAPFKAIAEKAGLETDEHEHPGAHMVPTTSGPFRDFLRDYFDDLLLKSQAAAAAAAAAE